MKIAVGADHAGVDCKAFVIELLQEGGHEITDMGTMSAEPVDYPDIARKVAEEVAEGNVDMGVLICGTGLGMSMSANRIHGVRAALCTNENMAELSRKHNDANVLCLGGRILSREDIPGILSVWLATAFEGGRHARRVAKIDGE